MSRNIRLPKCLGCSAGIAHFAQAVRPTAWPLPDDLAVRLGELAVRLGELAVRLGELAVRLGELMARRRQLMVMINAEKQRLGKAQDRIAQRFLQGSAQEPGKRTGRASTRRSTN